MSYVSTTETAVYPHNLRANVSLLRARLSPLAYQEGTSPATLEMTDTVACKTQSETNTQRTLIFSLAFHLCKS